MNELPVSQWQWTTKGIQRDFAAAYAHFRTALKDASQSEQMEEEIINAYAKYAEALQEPWMHSPELSRRATEHYTGYMECLRKAFGKDDSRQRILDAYKKYVEGIKLAWQQIDVNSMHPEDLAAISQSIAWVASIVGEITRANF